MNFTEIEIYTIEFLNRKYIYEIHSSLLHKAAHIKQ